MPKRRKPDMPKAGDAPEERPAQSDVERAIKAIVEKITPNLLKPAKPKLTISKTTNPKRAKTKGRSGE